MKHLYNPHSQNAAGGEAAAARRRRRARARTCVSAQHEAARLFTSRWRPPMQAACRATLRGSRQFRTSAPVRVDADVRRRHFAPAPCFRGFWLIPFLPRPRPPPDHEKRAPRHVQGSFPPTAPANRRVSPLPRRPALSSPPVLAPLPFLTNTFADVEVVHVRSPRKGAAAEPL